MSENRENRVFTLVEMLVVVAIICVLCALLLPGLRGARDMATAASCANNQKQIGVAFGLYVNDYNGWCPPVKTAANLWWASEEILGGSLGRKSGVYDIRNSPLFCPSDRRQMSLDWHDKDYPDRFVIVGSSNYGAAYPDPWTATKQIKISQIPAPSTKIFVVDTAAFYGYPYVSWNGIMTWGCANSLAQLTAGANPWAYLPFSRHRDQFNAVYADGHVQREKFFGAGVVEKYTRFKYEATSTF